jgi:hypothetical protein
MNILQADDGTDKIHASDRLTVKRTIVELMLKSPEQLQRQVIRIYIILHIHKQVSYCLIENIQGSK